MATAGALLAVVGYALVPESVGGRFWTGSAWMLLSPLLIAGRFRAPEFANRTQFILQSGRRSNIHLMELFGAFFCSVCIGVAVVGDVTLPALVLGVWGGLLCGISSVLEQVNLSNSTTLLVGVFVGGLFWSSPFWLGPWLGEPGFTPWLASWLMWLHPVSLALSLAGLTNLIEPIFYSVTLIGVVEVELFDPHGGLIVLWLATMVSFGASFMLNRRRSGSLYFERPEL